MSWSFSFIHIAGILKDQPQVDHELFFNLL